MELLARARSEAQLGEIGRFMAPCITLPAPSVDYEMAVIFRQCRRGGMTRRKMTDYLVAPNL